MKRLLILLFVFVSVHLSLTAHCNATLSPREQSEAQIRQAITQAASAMKTMQCDFTQTKHLKMLNDKMTSKGRMYYQQTNRLRWEYTSLYSYTFILNDDKVLLKNKQRNDVIDVNPTAENMARWIQEQVPHCYKVQIQESEGNIVEYEV